jgi:hypothetical protein
MICESGIGSQIDEAYIIEEILWTSFFFSCCENEILNSSKKLEYEGSEYYLIPEWDWGKDSNHYIKAKGRSAFNLYTRSEYRYDNDGYHNYCHAGVFDTKEEAEACGIKFEETYDPNQPIQEIDTSRNEEVMRKNSIRDSEYFDAIEDLNKPIK